MRWWPLLALHMVLTVWTLALPLAPLRSLDPALAVTVLVELRLPRALLALGYGAALGATGAALQALFANPLASPDVTGSSSGAALGAVFAAYWLSVTAPLPSPAEPMARPTNRPVTKQQRGHNMAELRTFASNYLGYFAAWLTNN